MNPSPYPAPFTSAHARATVVKILLVVGAVAAGLSLFAEALTFAFPPLTDEQELTDNPFGTALLFIVLLIAVFELIIYVATVVVFLMWLYRAYNNLRAIGPGRRLDHSPGWAVASFFVPFANLVIPYRAVKEVWQKSGPAHEAFLSEPGPPARFPVWWMFWLLASFAGNISMRVSFNDNVPPSTATMVSMIAGVTSIAAAVFAYLVVDAIDKRQEEASGRAKLAPAGPPPPPAELMMRDVVTAPAQNISQT